MSASSTISAALFAATLCVTSSPAPAEALPAQAQLAFFAGDHGWAVCRYVARLEMPGRAGSRYTLTIQLAADWIDPSVRSGLSLRRLAGTASEGPGPRLSLGAEGSAPLIEADLTRKDGPIPLPAAGVLRALRALGERDDLLLRIDDGGRVSTFGATPAKPASTEEWRACLDGISRDQGLDAAG